MKQMLLAVFSALCFSATAQITVTNSCFPSVGDTVRTAAIDSADASYSVLITAPGGPTVWDLSNAEADYSFDNVFRFPSEGTEAASFPTANLLVVSSDGESYFNKTATEFKVLGYSGADPSNLGLDVTVGLNPPLAERHAPLNLFSNFLAESSASLTFGVNELPDTISSQIPGGFVDSIRVNITTQRQEIVDGFGTVKLAIGDFPVLRLRRTEFNTTGVEVHLTAFGTWIDLGSIPGGGGGLGDFIGTDTTITHRFFANDEPQEVAVLTLNNDASAVQSIRYKTDQVSAVDEPDGDAPGNASITAYPNPAIEWVRFDCYNLPQDDYTLKIYNIIGKQVWKETYYQVNGNKRITLDLDQFKKGTYLYSMVNSRGTVIGTKRLVVVKP